MPDASLHWVATRGGRLNGPGGACLPPEPRPSGRGLFSAPTRSRPHRAQPRSPFPSLRLAPPAASRHSLDPSHSLPRRVPLSHAGPRASVCPGRGVFRHQSARLGRPPPAEPSLAPHAPALKAGPCLTPALSSGLDADPGYARVSRAGEARRGFECVTCQPVLAPFQGPDFRCLSIRHAKKHGCCQSAAFSKMTPLFSPVMPNSGNGVALEGKTPSRADFNQHL